MNLNHDSAENRSDRRHTQRLSTILLSGQLGGAAAVSLAIGRLQHLPLDAKNIVSTWVWVAISLAVLIPLCWYDKISARLAKVVGFAAGRQWIAPLSEARRLSRLQLIASYLIILDVALLIVLIRKTGGFVQSPLDLFLPAILVTTIILRSPRKRGLTAVWLQVFLLATALWWWRFHLPLGSSPTRFHYDAFGDPGFLPAFTIVAGFVLVFSVLCLRLQKAELADRASNVFFSNESRISYAARMGRRGEQSK